MTAITNFIRDEEGATAVEYGLMAALIAAVIITAVTAVGTSLSKLFDGISTSLTAAAS
ncbi:Flp family type IVb pilin [Desulfovibrio sp. TomC]|uniref:Flp family type IVb pilin n=1 Tax=Desulfovibrio sp. TomC TaxID=1562888 RepID=UPI0005750915|nr:Flp family type IVb pilin [Desulfovibrio sp. TomC]KHK02588.1 Flp pilus assembly protein, pilin Flp [Desulfovibrio sp. TomC]